MIGLLPSTRDSAKLMFSPKDCPNQFRDFVRWDGSQGGEPSFSVPVIPAVFSNIVKEHIRVLVALLLLKLTLLADICKLSTVGKLTSLCTMFHLPICVRRGLYLLATNVWIAGFYIIRPEPKKHSRLNCFDNIKTYRSSGWH